MDLKISKHSLIDFYLLSVVIFQIGTLIRVQLNFHQLGNAVRIMGVVMLVYSLVKLAISGKFNKFQFWMFFLYYWNILNILISIFTGGLDLTRAFGEDSYLLNMFLPFLLLFDVKTLNYKRLFQYSILFAVFALAIIVFNFKYIILANNVDYVLTAIEENENIRTLAQIPIMWSIPAAIVLLNMHLVKKSYVVIALVAFTLAIAFSMAFGRRSTSLYGVVFLVITYYLYFKNPNYKLSSKIKLSLFLGFAFVILVPFTFEHFSYLVDRGLVDSRSAVNNAYFKDMGIVDYIFGRGVNGTYYDPMSSFRHLNYRRFDNETGFLNVILHSGLLFLIPYLILGIYAFYKGFFKSKSVFIKSFALYIIVNDLMLILGSYPSYSIRFFILWIGIDLCYNRELRSKTDQELLLELKI